MPQAALTVAVFAAQAVGTAVSAGIVAVAGASAATLAAGAALSSIAYSSYAAKKTEADARKDAARSARDITVRSAIEPARIIYGTARTSGPVVYTNTAPTLGTSDNSTLWTAISLCQHEIDDITEIWLDGDQILSSAIDWAGTGGVTSGKYGPIGSNEVTNFYRRLGTDTQTHVTELATAISDWTSDYDGRGVAYIVSAFELGTATGEGVWAQGAPKNIRAVIKGKKVYDPRKDSTQTGGSGAHRLADPTTWEWSDNPALCVADYLFDARLGMGAEGITYNEIDWELVFAAANVCDTLVTTPDGNQKRFTCNGALSTGETYAENIKQLLSSMSGQITWSGGKFRIRAAAYEAPTYSFTGDDVVGDVQIQPERTRTQRYNKIRGTFIDPDSDYVATQFIPVENTSYKNTRDGGQTLTQEIKLPFTNDEYMAQRIAFKQLNLNNQQLRCIVPFNWKAMKVAVGDRIQLSIDELSWSNKVFRVDGWSFSPDSGFNLELQEDSSSAYADPGLSDYSTRTLAGTVSFADQAVSAPSGLQATSEEEAVLLEWDPPPRPSGYDEVVIYASATSAWSGASEIGRTRGSTFRHELTRGTARYYWVRAVDVDGRESIRDPDSDTSTVTATAGQIATSQLNDDASFADTADWPQVTGVGRPEDNATVGATVGTDLYDTDGTTVLGTADVINSVLAQEILQVETEGEEILDLETGNAVDIQNLGDVAIFVNESNTTINTRIDTTNTNLSNLQNTVVDLTSGVSDIFLQATAPVAGVGGVPDPIPTFSRWYDTDDNNAPYYWDGSQWLSLEDPRIGANESAITSLSSRMTTAEGDIDTNTAAAAANASDISANASAISTLDTTVTSQGSTIASLSTQQTALTATLDFITKVEDEAAQEPIDLETSGVLDLETLDDVTSATSSAITSLDVRTTAAEGTLVTQATEITELQSVLSVDGEFSATVNAIETLGTRITSNDDELSTVAGQITALQSTVNDPTTGVDANATAISGLTTRVDSAEGNITVLTSEVVAIEGILQDPDGNYSASANAIQTLETVLQDDGGGFTASSNAITELNSTVDGNTASITTQATSINGLEAQYTVKIDNNNRVAGFGLASTAADATPFSEFVVVADQFSIVNPASTADTPLTPFQVVSNKARFTTDVQIDGSLLINGTVDADAINVTNLAAISADLGTVTAGSLASSLITGDISTFVTFADTTSQDVIEDDGEVVIQTFLLPGNSLGLQPIIIATAYFIYNTGMDQNGSLVFRVRQGQNSTSGTVVSTLIIHNRRESGVIESGSINIIGVDSEKTADQYYSITVDVDSGNTTDGATFSNVRGVVIGGR